VHPQSHADGYQVVEEFVDRGESAKTANRPGLRALLARIDAGDIDAVVCHKIDRLSRSRADDVQIAMQIRAAGAQLVSATENIDETPSGLLLHGIMSSIAEFYSRNLAAESMKGTTQKAKKGGTPFKAPIGYLNTREWIDGREIRTVIIDPERAPLVQHAFELYATGDYSLLELGAVLGAQGLRSKPGRRGDPPKPLGPNRLSTMLRNEYYIGIVNYAGSSHKGRHEALIDNGVFDKVQQILDAQRQSGERSWICPAS
jgi:DNA invertase Pin-like site-specific DNA recombinase